MSLILKCDMTATCFAPVTHIDEKGYVYCAAHGVERRQFGRRCRKLTKPETKQLLLNQPLAQY